MRNESGFAIIDLLFVCGIIGVLSAIALPRLASAKGAATSASAVASMRVIGSAQVTFAITCGSGFYAPSLTALAKPPAGGTADDGFIKGDLGAADTVVKSNYTIQMTATPFGGAPDTCNALGVGQTGQAFKAGADSLDPNFPRFFAVNAGNVVWEHNASIYAGMPEAGDSPTGRPINR
jgi:type II secretory pathway pseudopilin PulG